jgi:hypothetical protein
MLARFGKWICKEHDQIDPKQCESQRFGTFRQQKQSVPKHAPKLNFTLKFTEPINYSNHMVGKLKL